MDVIGAVVAKVAGKPLPNAVADFVTRPLDLRDTGFVVRRSYLLAAPCTDGQPAVRITPSVSVPFGATVHLAPDRACSIPTPSRPAVAA